MDNLPDRVKFLLKDRGLTQKAAEEVGDLGRGFISDLLNGKKLDVRGDALSKLAKGLNTSEDFLLRKTDIADPVPKDGPKEPSAGHYRPPPKFFDTVNTMPVFAAAEGGKGNMIVSVDEVDRIPRPYTLENVPEAYGILIVGESMFPAFRPGETAWVNPRLPPMRDEDAILYQVKERDGESLASIKQIVGWTDREWTLQQWNPPKKFKLDRGLWKTAHRVVGKFSRR